MAKPNDRYYAYCTNGDYYERHARGFVLAPNLQVALAKAKVQVTKERKRVARWLKMKYRDMPALGRTHRVRVWADPSRSCAPNCKHYTEKGPTDES